MGFSDKITKPKLRTVAVWVGIFWLSKTTSLFLLGGGTKSVLIYGVIGAFLVIGLISKTKGFKLGNGIVSIIFLGLSLSLCIQIPFQEGEAANYPFFCFNNLNIYSSLPILQLIATCFTAYATLFNKHFTTLYSSKEDVTVFRKNLFKLSLAAFIVMISILVFQDLKMLNFI